MELRNGKINLNLSDIPIDLTWKQLSAGVSWEQQENLKKYHKCGPRCRNVAISNAENIIWADIQV